jgi:hypothetical protein
MLSAIKGRLSRPRQPGHIRVHSQDDLTQLTQLTPRAIYGNTSANPSQEYFDRSPSYVEGFQNPEGGDGDQEPLTSSQGEFRRGMRDDGYSSPPLPVTMPIKRKRKSKFSWTFVAKLAFCFGLFGTYVLLYSLYYLTNF